MKEDVNLKIKTFRDLKAWQEGHALVLMVYNASERLPSCERFELCSQMRRSAISITSNIAEGFGRQTYKEKIQFYYIALGSLTELQNQLIVTKDTGRLGELNFKEIYDKSVEVHKIINGLIKKSKTYLNS